MSDNSRELGVPTIVIPVSYISGLFDTEISVSYLWSFNAGLNAGVSGQSYVTLRGGPSSSIAVDGPGASYNLFIRAKGTGAVNVGPALKMGVDQTNHLQVTGAATGLSPTLSAVGVDADISIQFSPKGTGTLNLLGPVYLDAAKTNYLQVTGAATGLPTTISAVGADTNVSIVLSPKGSGGISLWGPTYLDGAKTNFLQADGAATGLSPTLSAVGADANINLKLSPKGTGIVQWGGDTIARTGYDKGNPSAIAVGASPFVYTNANVYPRIVLVSATSGTTVEYSRDETTWYAVPYISNAGGGVYFLAPGDSLRVTYTTAPTMTTAGV